MARTSPWNGSSKFLDSRVFNIGCIVIFFVVFPLVQIIIGSVYMYDCPVAPVIPVYVVVWGTTSLLLIATFGLSKLLGPAAPHNTLRTVWICSLFLFIIIWLIYGSYHIYSIYPPNYDKNLTNTERDNNGIYSTALPPGRRLGLSPENQNQNQNQNQSLPNLNRTSMTNNNQTLMEIIQSLALSNITSRTNGEHPNAPRVTAAVPYCDKTVYLFAFWPTTLIYVFTLNILASINCCK